MEKKPTVQFPIYLTEKKYKALFRKAQIECNTAAPVHDVLDLLLVYYLKNTFILHRRMRRVNPLEGKKPRTDTSDKRKVWMRLPRNENRRFTRKVEKERISKTYVMNLLIDFYLKKEFEIETRIVRVNR
jgi:hypothetical protein